MGAGVGGAGVGAAAPIEHGGTVSVYAPFATNVAFTIVPFGHRPHSISCESFTAAYLGNVLNGHEMQCVEPLEAVY